LNIERMDFLANNNKCKRIIIYMVDVFCLNNHKSSTTNKNKKNG